MIKEVRKCTYTINEELIQLRRRIMIRLHDVWKNFTKLPISHKWETKRK